MSQHDFSIANQGFPSFRADLNSGLEALATNSSGATAPTTTYAYQFWYDTANDLLKMRNGDNDAWITLAAFDQANDEWELRSAVIQAFDGAGVSIKTDEGTTRFSVSDSGQVSFQNYSFPTADGSANQVLQTDGSGALSFVDVASTVAGLFHKSDRDVVAWTKTGNGTAETQVDLVIDVNDQLVNIASGTSISMPTLTAGTDYAIWCAPDGTLEADISFTAAPTANGRLIGGFHYAPGGNATFNLDAGDGGTTAQINEYSFWDLKWRPSAIDPRGLTLVGDGAFWAGMYHMSANHLTGPVHKYGVNPCVDGNPPQNTNGSGNYPNASPANIIESLQYHGFRAPNFWEFQLLAFGVNEERSIGGSGPGLTGDVTDRGKDQQTSAWGVFDATGVLNHWGNDTILTTSNQTLPNPSRGGLFRYSNFATFGGSWGSASFSGSRLVSTNTATNSSTFNGSRGVCDHLILD